jgi:hypothetical protein
MKITGFIFVIVVFIVCFSEFCGGNEEQAVNLRSMKYTQRSKAEAMQWQAEMRERLFQLLKLDDLLSAKIALNPKIRSTEDHKTYVLSEMEIQSTVDRTIDIMVSIPKSDLDAYPAVVCIHGHGGDRRSVYDVDSVYKGFAAKLAEKDVVTISCDVGQHEVYEEGRLLMGERLWNVIRCVDVLQSLPRVDKHRIGCAGLSLGGEMAMWLGAMDERVQAVVSSGFLTMMDQMEQNHCMCWKFDGLRELVDFPDIYSLIAPRALQCQNGLKEGPKMFYPALAQAAMEEVRQIYEDLGAFENVEMDVHAGGHEMDLEGMMRFFENRL